MRLIQALMTYLKLPNETTAQFAVEIKKLSEEDKAWFREQFKAQGIPIDLN